MAEIAMDTSDLESVPKLGSTVKQVEEKHASTEIREMVWSPKMDLVAAITASEPNDVILYRLHALKKVWSHSPPADDAKVTSIAWDPLGKCIAVAYSVAQIQILAVERAVVLHTHHISSTPIKLYWLSLEKDPKQIEVPLFKDISEKMIPNLPSLNRENELHQSVKQINRDVLNYLVVSGEHGLVNIYVYGLLSIGYINLLDYSSQESRVVSSCLSSSGSHVVSITEDFNANVHLTCLSTDSLCERSQEIQIIADKFIRLIDLLEYCDLTITKMSEAWEDGLLEMDSKLNNFSNQKQMIGEGTVLNDFLELLLFGTPSDELQTFLLKDLTDRGMKKLGMSLQNYYKTIQELLIVNMQSAVESIFFHLNDLHGLSQWPDKFGAIGLTSDLVDSAIQACGSLRLKINEMIHLLTSGTENLKAFSRWLYTVILRLSDQTVPADLEKSPPDYHAVADFLHDNFDGHEENGSHIKLEKVGQYLKGCDLRHPAKVSEKNLWSTLEKSPILTGSKYIYKSEPDKSLVQLYQLLVSRVSDALTSPSASITKSLSVGSQRMLAKRFKMLKIRQFASKSEGTALSNVYSVYLGQSLEDNSEPSLMACRLSLGENNQPLYRCELKFGALGNNPAAYGCQTHRVVDFDYYDKEELMILLQQTGGENSQNYLTLQLNLDLLPDNAWNSGDDPVGFDVGQYVNLSNIKILENVTKAVQVSVSGKRDIGSVMLSSRRVRLFMYRVEEDDSDDEEEDMMSQGEAENLDDSSLQAGGGSDKENMN